MTIIELYSANDYILTIKFLKILQLFIFSRKIMMVNYEINLYGGI